MNKLSLIVASLVISQIAVADEVKKNDWTLNGNIRTAFISDSTDKKNSKEIHDLAVGGSITILTPKIKGFNVGATLYTSQPLFGQHSDQFLTENDGSSYSYLGEAYIAGTAFGKTSLILGRKVINTPFANSDDIGMTPNSFEVYLVQNKDVENVTFTAGRVVKWAGIDAPTRGKFTDLTNGDGVSVMAVNYADNDLGLQAQAWYYHVDNFAKTQDVGISYFDSTYSLIIDDKTTVNFSGQFTQFQHINGDEKDGTVIGIQSTLSLDALTLGFAYNQADGDNAPLNGFGGGPFYTSSDILTIQNSGQDSTAWRLSGGYNIDSKTSVGFGYAGFAPKNGSDLSEIDISASYSYNQDLTLSLYVESWTTQQNSDIEKTDSNFEYSIFANYSF